MLDSLLQVRYNNKRKTLVDFSEFGHLFATQLSCDSCVAFLLPVSVNALTIDPEIHILQHSSYLRFVLGKGTAPFDTSIINHGLSYNLDFKHIVRNYTILCFDTNKRSLQIRLILRICRERLLNLLFHHPIIFIFGSSSIMNKGYKGKLGVINFPYR